MTARLMNLFIFFVGCFSIHNRPLFALESDQPILSWSGSVKFDQAFFVQDKDTEKSMRYYNGANLGSASLTLGVTFDPVSTVDFEVEVVSSSLSLGILIYTRKINDNLLLKIGQILASNSQESAGSTKWSSFMNRSMPVKTFTGGIGPGLSLRYFTDHLTVSAATFTSPYGKKYDSGSDKNDRWSGNMRIVFRPVFSDSTIVDTGFASTFHSTHQPLDFTAGDEIKTRHKPTLVSTSVTNGPEVSHISATDYTVFTGELGVLHGSFNLEGDYIQTHVNRKDNSLVKFGGWHIQGNYFLTGESRSYSTSGASFGKPTSIQNPDLGAWQIGYRTSFINLIHKDIYGGKQLNHGLALNWYVDKKMKLALNYILAKIWPNTQTDPMTVHMIGTRIQLVW